MISDLLAVAAPYGPVGLICVYLVWRQQRTDRREDKRDERLETIMEARAEADKDLAVAMTLLAERVR
jgi:hypothetical protein